MKETALLHSMAMLLQDMLERNEISEELFMKRINEISRHCGEKLINLEHETKEYEKLYKTLDSLYCMDYKVKPLSY